MIITTPIKLQRIHNRIIQRIPHKKEKSIKIPNEYWKRQEITDKLRLVDNTPNHPFKFMKKIWVEINDDTRVTYINCQIKFKTTMLKLSSWNYSDAGILVKGTIIVMNTAVEDADAKHANKNVIFKNCALFSDCMSEINNTQIGNAKDLDVAMAINNLMKYSDNYSKTFIEMSQL